MATVVESSNLLKDAALVVDECFSVEEGDVVTIICDEDREDEARAVAEVCVERGAWPVIMNNETQVARGLADAEQGNDAILFALQRSSLKCGGLESACHRWTYNCQPPPSAR